MDNDSFSHTDPRYRFKSPELLMEDQSLSDGEKHDLLRGWELDLDSRLKAEDEGMSASDPIRGDREAKLADEAGRVRTYITALEGKRGQG